VFTGSERQTEEAVGVIDVGNEGNDDPRYIGSVRLPDVVAVSRDIRISQEVGPDVLLQRLLPGALRR
jgi:hypothetical protein